MTCKFATANSRGRFISLGRGSYFLSNKGSKKTKSVIKTAEKTGKEKQSKNH
jgi:hypothetical protein